MRRSTDRILTTHPGRLPNPKNGDEVLAARNGGDQQKLDELVAERIVRYANLMGRENVIAGLDCGVGGRCYPDIGRAKLKSLVGGAALASKQLWAS